MIDVVMVAPKAPGHVMRDAEVYELHRALIGHQDVRRADVAMHDVERTPGAVAGDVRAVQARNDHVLVALAPHVSAKSFVGNRAFEEVCSNRPTVNHRPGVVVCSEGGGDRLGVEEIQIYKRHLSRSNVKRPGQRVHR